MPGLSGLASKAWSTSTLEAGLLLVAEQSAAMANVAELSDADLMKQLSASRLPLNIFLASFPTPAKTSCIGIFYGPFRSTSSLVHVETCILQTTATLY